MVDGRSHLPRRPEAVSALLVAACRPGSPPSLDALVSPAVAAGGERVRCEALAAWLPLSRVARWSADGRLKLHPHTSPRDLALRLSAWALDVTHDDAAARAWSEAMLEGCQDDDPVGGRDPGDAEPMAASAPDGVSSPWLSRVQALLSALDASFVERRDAARLSLLSALAGQHVLLVGPPGTGKSLLARAICACFDGTRYFEYLLSRFTQPDELFGPVSVPALKEEDFRRVTLGYLPQAHVVFLDEVFKAGSAILNSLLTLINERIYHHGRHRDVVPLVALIGASNELPDPGDGLGALLDRFAVRLWVGPSSESDAFLRIATGALPAFDPPSSHRLTLDDLASLRSHAAAVDVPQPVRRAMVEVWRRAQDLDLAISDRRWRAAMDLLRTAAAVEGRNAVVPLDLLLLGPVLVSDADQIDAVRSMLAEVLAPKATPSHDLGAQWRLLAQDRVAPCAGQGIERAAGGPGDALALRRRQAARMVARVREAVDALAADRQRWRGSGDQVFLAELPPALLGAHLRGSRELSEWLDRAQRYHAATADESALARAMLLGLPPAVRRDFAAGVVLRIRLVDTDVEVGVTLTGEGVPPPAEHDPATSSASSDRQGLARWGASRVRFEQDLFARAPQLRFTAAELLAWARGELGDDAVLSQLAGLHHRNALLALERVRRQLDSSGLPRPAAVLRTA